MVLMIKSDAYQNYIKEIYKYSYFCLKNKEQAEDVTSETFLRFFEKKRDLAKIDEKAFLIGISRNIIYEKYREKQKYSKGISDQQLIEEQDDKSYSMEHIVIEEKLLEQIKSNLDSLDELTKEILILKIWEDLRFQQISDIVEENINTVKTRYYKGIDDLKININNKSKTQLRSVSIPMIIGSIILISNNNQYVLSTSILNQITNTSLFIKSISMNMSNASIIGATGVKAGILATTSAKVIALVVAGVAVVGTTIIGVTISNTKVKAPAPLSYSSNDSSNSSSSYSSIYNLSSQTNSSLSNLSLSQSTSSIILSDVYKPVIPAGWSIKGSKLCSVNFPFPSNSAVVNPVQSDQSRVWKFSEQINNPTTYNSLTKSVGIAYSATSLALGNDYVSGSFSLGCGDNSLNLSLNQWFDKLNKEESGANNEISLEKVGISKKWGNDVLVYKSHGGYGEGFITYLLIANNKLYRVSTTVMSSNNSIINSINTIFNNLEFTNNVINVYGSDWVKEQYKYMNTPAWEFDHPQGWITKNSAGLIEGSLEISGNISQSSYTLDLGYPIFTEYAEKGQFPKNVDEWVSINLKMQVPDDNARKTINIINRDRDGFAIRVVTNLMINNSYKTTIYIWGNGAAIGQGTKNPRGITLNSVDTNKYDQADMDMFIFRFADGINLNI